MAPHYNTLPEIQRLRRQLEASRWEMHCALSEGPAAAASNASDTAVSSPPDGRHCAFPNSAPWALTAVAATSGVIALQSLPRLLRAFIAPGGLFRLLVRTVLPLGGIWFLWRPAPVTFDPQLGKRLVS